MNQFRLNVDLCDLAPTFRLWRHDIVHEADTAVALAAIAAVVSRHRKRSPGLRCYRRGVRPRTGSGRRCSPASSQNTLPGRRSDPNKCAQGDRDRPGMGKDIDTLLPAGRTRHPRRGSEVNALMGPLRPPHDA